MVAAYLGVSSVASCSESRDYNHSGTGYNRLSGGVASTFSSNLLFRDPDVHGYDRKDEELNNLRKYGTIEPTNIVDTEVSGEIPGGYSNGMPSFSVGAKGSTHTHTFRHN